MSKRIIFLVDDQLNEAIEAYTNDKRIQVSSFIRELISNKLIEENYLEVSKNE